MERDGIYNATEESTDMSQVKIGSRGGTSVDCRCQEQAILAASVPASPDSRWSPPIVCTWLGVCMWRTTDLPFQESLIYAGKDCFACKATSTLGCDSPPFYLKTKQALLRESWFLTSKFPLLKRQAPKHQRFIGNSGNIMSARNVWELLLILIATLIPAWAETSEH